MDEPRDTPPTKALTALAARFDELAGGLGAAQRAWPGVVGDLMARNCMPVKLHAGELRVRCSSASWASELHAMSREVLARLEAPLGAAAPATLRAYTGRLPGSLPPTEPAGPPPRLELPEAAVQEAHRSLPNIPDGPLRESVAKALAAARLRQH